jgi:uncharacterized protein YgbK (DUF1537 family)
MVSRSIVMALAAAWAFAGQAQQTDAKKEVMAVVEGSIKLITEKKYAELIKTYIWPAEVEKLTARFGSVDNAAAEMAKGDSMATVLKALQTAAKLEPAFEGDGSVARFRFDTQIGRDSGLKLEKLNGKWYLRD